MLLLDKNSSGNQKEENGKNFHPGIDVVKNSN